MKDFSCPGCFLAAGVYWGSIGAEVTVFCQEFGESVLKRTFKSRRVLSRPHPGLSDKSYTLSSHAGGLEDRRSSLFDDSPPVVPSLLDFTWFEMYCHMREKNFTSKPFISPFFRPIYISLPMSTRARYRVPARLRSSLEKEEQPARQPHQSNTAMQANECACQRCVSSVFLSQ